MSNNYHKALPSLELLLDYLDGILDEDSTRQIEYAIDESDELKSIVEGIRVYYEEEGKDRAKLEVYADQIRGKFYSSTTNDSEHNSGFQKTPAFWFRTAAAIGLFLIAGTVLLYNTLSIDVEQLVSHHIQDHYDAPLTFRGDNDPNQLMWSDIVDSYLKKDFELSLVKLEKLPDYDDRRLPVDFYTGLCNLYKKGANYEKAIESLKLVSDSEHRLNEKAEWYLALAYYQNSEEVKAKALLQKITEKNFYKRKEAKKLLMLLSE